MERWQIFLVLVFVLAPFALMLDFWGDERLTFRGRPVSRPWQKQVEHAPGDDHH